MGELPTVITEQTESIIRVTLNRPNKKNALTQSMYSVLADALALLDEQPQFQCLIIRANGDSFTAGNDISEFLSAETSNPDQPVQRFLRALAATSKPIIAAVNGPAIGIGLTMLLHCEFIFASNAAVFAAPFGPLGLVPEAGSSQLLPQRIGYPLAQEMFLLGRSLSAEQAFSHGLINQVVAAEKLWSVADDTAKRIAELPAGAAQSTKQLCRQPLEPLGKRIEREVTVFAEQLRRPQTRAVLKAFVAARSGNPS